MSVKLEGSETNLEEVIITAQGIKGKNKLLDMLLAK
jgi:hypothetical protein